MNLPDELIREHKEGAKVIDLSRKYGIEYNVLYWKLGDLGIRNKVYKSGYRGAYKRRK